MKGICKLYDIEAEILESHIIPKFVIEHMKKSGSNFIRNYNQPNRRKQDGPKKYLLCSEAEKLFGIREKWFAENIFTPYLIQKKHFFKYDENLYFFTVSLLWRVLIINMDYSIKSNQPYKDLLFEAEREWKLFLKEYKYPRTHNRFYLYFTDRIMLHNLELKGVDNYMTRTLDATIVSNQNETFVAVYVKFLRFVFWGVLKGGDEEKLKDLKIEPLKGEFIIPQKFEEDVMISFFFNRIKELNLLSKPSKNQNNIILKDLLKNKEEFFNSDAGQSILNDKINLDKKNNDFDSKN